MKIISVTGTKGKTTVVRMMDYVLKNILSTDTLRVDSDGHYINNRQKSTDHDSRNMIKWPSTACPGRYLIDLYRKNPEGVAIFECALSSGHAIGIGYQSHNVGVFTNIYEDHINYNRLRNKKDLFDLKSFIIERVAEGGYLVANFDDLIISKNTEKLLPKDVHLLPFGKTFRSFDTQSHINKKGNFVITCDDKYIILKNRQKEVRLIDYTKISITYNGLYLPSVYNIMATYGAVLAFLNFDLSYIESINKSLEKFSVDSHGARLVNIKGSNERLVIIDYAHETESLKLIAQLGHKLGKRVVGVLRLAPERTDKKILETGKEISKYYDHVIVYDKIDGIKRFGYKNRKGDINRNVGDVSNIFYRGLLIGRKEKKTVERVIIEEEALKKASEISQKGDVIVVISGDNHGETYDNVKKYFCKK